MVHIRTIRSGEGAALRAIRLRALTESPWAFGATLASTEAMSMEEWERRAARHAAGEDRIYFIAEDADRWVGMAAGFLEETEEGSSVELLSMWVEPSYRGRGLGRRLVEQVMTWARARGAGGVGLWVTESNTAAITLYRRCSFARTGERQPLPSNPALTEERMVRLLDLSAASTRA
jgi:ribosomal protein S18 acetylase RimI-like enzyme